MSTYSIIIERYAQNDILQHAEYIAYCKKSPETAARLVRGFYEQITRLRENPNRYNLDRDPDIAVKGIRRCYYKQYTIYYLVDEANKVVYIIRLLHSLMSYRSLVLGIFNE